MRGKSLMGFVILYLDLKKKSQCFYMPGVSLKSINQTCDFLTLVLELIKEKSVYKFGRLKQSQSGGQHRLSLSTFWRTAWNANTLGRALINWAAWKRISWRAPFSARCSLQNTKQHAFISTWTQSRVTNHEIKPVQNETKPAQNGLH